MASRTITMRAGESIFIDFPKKDGTAIDATMSGTYDLQDDSDASVASGSLVKSGDTLTFELRIADTETTGLADGTYTLLVLVSDSASGYADYIYEEIVKIRS